MRTLIILLLFITIGCSKVEEQPEVQNQQSRIDLVVSGDTSFVVHAEGDDLVEFYGNHILLRLPESLLFAMKGASEGYFSVYPFLELEDKSVFVTSKYQNYNTFNTRGTQLNVLHVSNPSRINSLTLYNYQGRCIEINGTFYYSGGIQGINY